MEKLFDLEHVYDEQISPVMTQIIAICDEHKMPILCSSAYKNDAETGESFCSTVLNNYTDRVVPGFKEAIRIIRPSNSVVAITIMSGARGEDHA